MESSRPSKPCPSQSIPPTTLAASDLGEFPGDRGGDRWVDGTGEIDERLVAAQLLEHGGLVRLVVQPNRHFLGDLLQPLLRVRSFRVLLLGFGELLLDATRLEGQRSGLDRKG